MNHELSVVALSESISSAGNFVLVLEDCFSKQRIPLIIGRPEAQSIAIAMKKMEISRPQTHDLFASTLTVLQAELKQVIINRFEKDVFYASIFIKKNNQEIIEIDARPSDAIALAVRLDCPIFATQEVIEQASFLSEDKFRDKKGSYAAFSLEELEQLLVAILAKEDYESAVRIREAIEKRKNR
ncbi:bifunctional nuclease family protein [Dyadobacter sp. 3J3]|uniref:bifunctional nuclease family protein n=1 Tax=Dyadobacter sp. 3J3 TaxID=2606600 RepID=UPI00135B5DE3|nr:bifunctional nuclease family protein [Dyadobacter sp. 3J3]